MKRIEDILGMSVEKAIEEYFGSREEFERQLEKSRKLAEVEYRKWIEEAILQSIGVPEIHRRKIIERKIIQTKALRKARQHLREIRKGRWFLLMGNVGVGKSFAIAWLLWKLIHPEKRLLYLPAREIPSLPESRLRKINILALDDVALELRETKQTHFERLVEYAYDNGIQLLMTTNIPFDDSIPTKKRTATLSKLYDERTIDRIREMAILEVVSGKSLRNG